MKNDTRRIKRRAVLCAVFAAIGACCSGQRIDDLPPVITETREVGDDLGRTVTIPAKLDRVVSLAPSLTEMIFAAGAGDRLVGVTTFCNYPAEALSIRKVGDTQTPNIESIIALKPQVVFVSTASQLEAFKATLEDNGIKVFVTNANSFENVLKNLRQLGELFRTEDLTAEVIEKLDSRVGAIRQRVAGKTPLRVFVQISREPLFTVGKQSFLTEIMRSAGGESVSAAVETAYPKLSKETALAMDPDVIILSASDDNREPNEVFKNSKAVKNGRVYSVDADILSRPGPRIVDAMEQIAEHLHGGRERSHPDN
jgi:iron complex transport system substrate-binding protein